MAFDNLMEDKPKHQTPADEMTAIEAILFVAVFLMVVFLIVYGGIVSKIVGIVFAMSYFMSQSEK